MIAGVRQFKLINGNGTEYDMTRPDALLHAPDGLGWGTERTVNRLGMTYIGINEKEIHQSPSGEMVFRTYEEYGRFLSFCQQGGLVLCYKPLDTWYYCECLISIQKSEIQWENNHLICPVQFTLLSYWYEKVVAQTAEPPEPVEPSYRTVTGDPAVFNARYSYPIKDLSVNIQGTQELNGYDKPWVGGRGKNKLPDSSHATVLNAYLNGDNKLAASGPDRTVIMPCEANTVYTFTWSHVQIAGQPLDNYSIASFADLPTIGSTGTRIAYGATATNLTFQTASDARYLAVKIANVARSEYPTTLNISMLEKGSTATAYEPYENICPITSFTSVTITQSGSTTNTYEVELTGAGQVYKGVLDVTSGELVVEQAVLTLNTANMNNDENYPGWRASGIRALVGRGKNGYGGNPSSITNNYGINTVSSNDILFFFPAQINNVRQTRLIDMAIDVDFLAQLDTPLTYQLTPTQLSNLIGQNSIQADAGEVTVTYRTDARTEYKVYPYQYSYKYGDTAQNVFDIDCDLPSYFKLTIFGERTSPSWRVVQNGLIVKSGKVNATIGSSQKLVINTDPKQTEIALYTLSNTRINNLYGYSDFATERIFALPQGECQVQVLTEDEQPPKVMIEVLKHV